MAARHRNWRVASLLLTTAFLVVAACIPLQSQPSGERQVDEGGATPFVLQVSSAATGPLRVDPANPRYFIDGSGKAILLAGSHTWFTMQDTGASDPPPPFDYNTFLDFVQARGYNFFRTFVWEESWFPGIGQPGDYRFLPNVYMRSTGQGTAKDGHPKFDLDQFNQAYFDRIRARVIQAGQRGLYVSLMLFEGFSVKDKQGSGISPYPGHPYNAANNINQIDGDPNHTGDGGQIQTLKIPAITAYQEAYVRKLIDTVNDLDNVLFEICNESEANQDNIDWQNHFIDFIHAYEAGKPKQHPVGFTVPWPGGNNAVLFASHADWISPNGDGGYDSNPPANDGKKVIISDTDHIWGLGGSADWVWKSFTRGLNPIFMDPYSNYASIIWQGQLSPNSPTTISVRANLTYILKYANRMNLEMMTPRADLCSSRYCLANPAANGAEYLVYLPSGATATRFLDKLVNKVASTYLSPNSQVSVDLSATTEQLSVEWFNPNTGQTIAGGTVSGGSSHSFTAPFNGSAVLYIYSTSLPTPRPGNTWKNFLPFIH
jgi:hypothetical protein